MHAVPCQRGGLVTAWDRPMPCVSSLACLSPPHLLPHPPHLPQVSDFNLSKVLAQGAQQQGSLSMVQSNLNPRWQVGCGPVAEEGAAASGEE